MRTFFIHIPKTGGTTVSSMIRTHINSPWQWAALPNGIVSYNTPTLGMGHVNYGIHEEFPDQDYQYFTMLRDPVERLWSHYYSVLRHNAHYLYEQAAELGPVKYVKDRSVGYECDNTQARMISGVGYGTGVSAEITEKDFETACRNLETFVVVGIHEHLRDTVRLVYRLWEWGEPETLIHAREGLNKPPVIPNDVRAAFEEVTVWDRKLYEFARSLFEVQRAELNNG